MKTQFLISLICIVFFGFEINAQTYVIQVKPYDSKYWGYADIDGDLIIGAKYPMCYEFSKEGIGIVYYPKRNLYQLINLKGEVLDIQPNKFLLKEPGGFGFSARGFRNGLVQIEINKKWGYLNTKGEIAIPIKYDYVSQFNGGYAIAKINRKYLILDSLGNETQINTYARDLKNFSENLAPYEDKKTKIGFINTKGEIAIPAQFVSVGYFQNGLAWARNNKNKIGYINKEGEWVIEPQFNATKNFGLESGLARARDRGDWRYVNKQGAIQYFDDADAIYDFCNGLARAKKSGLIGFINSDLEWAIFPEFDAARDFKNGYAAVKSEGGWGIIDKEGNWIIPPIYDKIKDVELVLIP